MSEINLLKEYCRMCDTFGECSEGCLINQRARHVGDTCQSWILDNFDQANEIITAWAQEHPEKPVRTRQDVFLERYPKAVVIDGVLEIHPCAMGFIDEGGKDCENVDSCETCHQSYWLAPAEEEEG
ncbi:MAG: hypothetical protein HFE64_03290 [Lachnospiraceae bacterium]|nr:hypothetical protein [Lachnospiraceae bacterium]